MVVEIISDAEKIFDDLAQPNSTAYISINRLSSSTQSTVLEEEHQNA
jgi:hypothetical protein